MLRKTEIDTRPDDEKRRASQRDRLFCATLSVALEHGFGRVTLDAVAERAGISKGGLLYHFPSKTKLITALLQRCQGVREEYKNEASSGAVADLAIDPLAVATLIASAEDPALLENVAERLLPRHECPEVGRPSHRGLQLMTGLVARLNIR